MFIDINIQIECEIDARTLSSHRGFGQVLGQIFDQVVLTRLKARFGAGFLTRCCGIRKYTVQVYWDRTYSVQFYWDIEIQHYYLLSSLSFNSP